MPGSRWTNVRPEMRAVIGGYTFRDIVQWSSNHTLQEIPSAMLMVGVGRRIDTQKASTIHRAASSLVTRIPAQVYMRMVPLGASAGDAENWPSKEFKVFDGRVASSGWSRSGNRAQFVIHLLHWLADLHYSSSVSASSHPSNPMDFTTGGSFIPSGSPPNAGIIDPAWTPMCFEQGEINEAALQTDLWAGAIQPWLVAMASRDLINLVQFSGIIDTPSKNDSAQKALARMPPLSKSKCYVPLALEFHGADGTAIANGITAALRQQTLASWANTTLWGKLVGEFAPSFFLGVVPRVEDTLIVPFAAGLREHFADITGSDYTSGEIHGQAAPALRAVGITHSVFMSTGANLGVASQSYAQPGIGGWFAPAGNDDGLIMLQRAPAWLSDPVQAWSYAAATTGADQGVVGSAFGPGEGVDPEGKQPAAIMESMVGDDNILSAYARQWYLMEMLKGRQGELNGKLRFDIAPGSTVRIEVAAEKFLGAADKLGGTIYGTVLRVASVINSEAKQAGTAFTIAHIRTEAENRDDKTSIDKPPFYQKGWPGCRLIDF